MEPLPSLAPCRRQLLTKIVPACAMSCLVAGSARAFPQEEQKAPGEKQRHKFDAPISKELTQAQLFRQRYGEVVQLAQFLQQELGGEETIGLLERATTANLKRYGAYLAQQQGTNSFASFVSVFRGPGFEDTLTKEVVIDTDTVFELKVTECLWAKTFRDMRAPEIGHAHICFGDYAMAEGYNPKIKMTRDKTLMQGDAFCNHHYTWEG